MHALRQLFAPFLALLTASCGGPDAAAELNLILISLDTCRADRLSCYGAARENTPALDRLARESVRFTDCIAQSALTAPSHMSLFTGQMVERHGLMNNRWGVTPPYTLASLLRDAGWRTAAFTGHGSMQAVHGVGTGFELFESQHQELVWPFTRHLAEVLPRALDWLARAPEPAFLFAHGYDPHCPYTPPEPWRERYAGWYRGGRSLERLCGPDDFRAEIDAGRVGADELRLIGDLYDAEVRAADEAIGSFVDELRRRGLLDRSILVFTSDHGEILGRRGWVGHGLLWEEALRVPLLVRFPGARWAGTVDAPVQLADVLPTLLSALRRPLPDGVQGADLMSLVRGEPSPLPADRLRVSRVASQVSARFGRRWKILFQELLGEQDGRPLVTRELAPVVEGNRELFDLEADPAEEHNLYATEAGRARFDELFAAYAVWRQHGLSRNAAFAGTGWRAVDTDEDLRTLHALGYAGEGGEDDGARDGGEDGDGE